MTLFHLRLKCLSKDSIIAAIKAGLTMIVVLTVLAQMTHTTTVELIGWVFASISGVLLAVGTDVVSQFNRSKGIIFAMIVILLAGEVGRLVGSTFLTQ